MAEALVSRLGPRIRTGTEVTSVRRVGARWCLDFGNATDEFDAVICAAPAHAASTMLAGDAPALGKLLGEIPYASAAVANFVWRETDFPEHPRSFGFVVPIRERRKIIAGSFSSLKYENRAPAGFITARAFLGGVLQTAMLELSDAELIAASREEFRDLLRVSADPIRASVRRWPQSMPQYEVGHIARVAQIETAAAKIPAFELAGSAYRGVGIPDCIHDAETAAEKIAAALAPEVSVK
jgi:oxygen-dependent protoporphyrinogen oxidase